MPKSQISIFQHRKTTLNCYETGFEYPQSTLSVGLLNHRFEPSRTCPNQNLHAQAGLIKVEHLCTSERLLRTLNLVESGNRLHNPAARHSAVTLERSQTRA